MCAARLRKYGFLNTLCHMQRYNETIMITNVENISNMFAKQPNANKVRQAYLFGSYARGCADENSDIDLCIETGSGFDLFALESLASGLEEDLGICVDIVCGEGSFYPRAHKRYLKDRVLIYEKC